VFRSKKKGDKKKWEKMKRAKKDSQNALSGLAKNGLYISLTTSPNFSLIFEKPMEIR
jgi:hypothetical protein